MRISRVILSGLAAMAVVATASGAFAQGCAGSECKPATTAVKGTTTFVKGTIKRPVTTVTRYRDIVKINNVTQVKDVTKTKYVDVIMKRSTIRYVQWVKRVNVVTRIQPITRIRTVTHVRTTPLKGKLTTLVRQQRAAPARAQAEASTPLFYRFEECCRAN